MEGVDIPPANMVQGNPGHSGPMGYYDPNYQYGGGSITRNIAGLLGGIGGNLLFPGAGLALGPLAKFAAGQFQRSGGVQDPMSGATAGPEQPSDSSKGGGGNQGIHYSQGGIPAPGGWGGVYGQGSGGNLGNYYGSIALKRLLSGGDTSLGFAGFPNANATAGALTLPVGLWGGALNKNFGNEGGTAIGPDFKGKSAN